MGLKPDHPDKIPKSNPWDGFNEFCKTFRNTVGTYASLDPRVQANSTERFRMLARNSYINLSGP